ncbi:hypothetical protein [Actinokineospora sp. NPDC004072]
MQNPLDVGAGRLLVPYIAAWTGEEIGQPDIVEHASGQGIAYRDEKPVDRDHRGILWDRFVTGPGQGKPRYAVIHPARQRHAMRKLLCQVCARPADTTDDGVLWLLPADVEQWPGWPNGSTVSEPPICRACVLVSVRHCPALRRSHRLVRVGRFPLHGVSGLLYRAGGRGPVAVGQATVGFGDPAVRWTLAEKLTRELDDCETVTGRGGSWGRR